MNIKESELFKLFKEDKLARGKSLNTLEGNEDGLNSFLSFLEEKYGVKGSVDDILTSVNSLKVLQFKSYLINSNYARSTVNTKMEQVLSYYTWLEENGIIAAKPIKVYKKIEEKDKKVKEYLTIEEAEKVFNSIYIRQPRENNFYYASRRNATMFGFLASFGLRIENLLSIKFKDIKQFKEGVLLLNIPKTKVKDVEVNVYISGRLLKVFEEYVSVRKQYNLPCDGDNLVFTSIKNGKLNKSNVIELLEKLMERNGIDKHITPHCFRVFASNNMYRVVDRILVKKLLGWSLKQEGVMGEVYFRNTNYVIEESIKACSLFLG